MKSKPELSTILELARNSFTKKEKKTVISLLLSQILVNLIDLIGVALLGIVGAIAISGIQSQEPSQVVDSFLSPVGLSDKTFQEQVVILSTAATSLLVTRSLISLKLNRATFRFFAGKSVDYSREILENLFSGGLKRLHSSSMQERIYATTFGCDILMIGVLAQVTVLLADISLLLFMGIGVFVMQPTIALTSILVFGFSIFYMHFKLNGRSRTLGQRGSELAVTNNRRIQELFETYKELSTSQKSHFLIDRFIESRKSSTLNHAEINYIPIVNKYFLESTLLIGALLVAGVEFILSDAVNAISGMAIFLAASSRIAPTLLRVQQNLLNIRNNIGASNQTIMLIQEVFHDVKQTRRVKQVTKTHSKLPEIELRNVSFSYHNSPRKTLSNVSLKISPGETIALMGPSGSGKTTLIDLILGLLQPSEGEVLIGGVSAFESLRGLHFSASYVPQEVNLISSSVLENIALGENPNEIDLDRLDEAVFASSLQDVIGGMTEGLQTLIGEDGLLLSGGQKQRLGLARALYRSPQLIVLDEPTSALDQETESFVSDSIKMLRNRATVIIIAHRISTLKNVDKIFYLEDGKLTAAMPYSDLIKNYPKIINPDENVIL